MIHHTFSRFGMLGNCVQIGRIIPPDPSKVKVKIVGGCPSCFRVGWKEMKAKLHLSTGEPLRRRSMAPHRTGASPPVYPHVEPKPCLRLQKTRENPTGTPGCWVPVMFSRWVEGDEGEASSLHGGAIEATLNGSPTEPEPRLRFAPT